MAGDGVAGDEETTPHAGPSVHVLVVDDHQDVQRLTARLLRRAGYLVHTADDGEQALEAAAALPRLDVLVSDIVMPGMRGPELARVLAERIPGLKVLLMTGYADPEVLAEVDHHGPVLRKPFHADELLDRVAALVRGSDDAAPPPEA